MTVKPTIDRVGMTSAFSLMEVVLAIALGGILISGMIVGYLQAAVRAEWSAYSLAAQSLAVMRLEQTPGRQVGSAGLPAGRSTGQRQPSGDGGGAGHSGGGHQHRLRHQYHHGDHDLDRPAAQDGPSRLCLGLWGPGGLHEHGGYLPRGRPMKIQNSTHRNGAGRDRRHEAAMTLVELMISLGLFVVTIVGFLFVHISGLELNQVVRAKLGASDEARRALSRLVGDIRAAGVIRVGSGDIDEFVPIATGQPQIGNAIQVYPEKGNNSRFIRYYWDVEDGRLKRTEDGNASEVVLAHSITNRLIFRGESHDGTVLTNNLNNRVIGLTMHFSQLVNPNIMIGQGGYFDYYQLHTRITRRALE